MSKIATILFLTFLFNLLHQIPAVPVNRREIREALVQVPFGDTVTLTCASNDENHSFFYWYINERNVIIGPTNDYDNAKFRYEVLSGNLTVKAVSKEEEGVYNCVSRGVRKEDVKIRSVRMVVQADWDEVLEEDPDPPFSPDFSTLELELENSNLKQMIGLLEVKNKILEEHCNVLREKNDYYHTKLKNLEQNAEKQEETEQTDENTDENNTSLKDRISGVLFGVALPKLGSVVAKIKEKHAEGGGDGRPCINIKLLKEKFEGAKLNLVRVAIVLSSLLLISGVGYGAYRIWKTRYRHPSYISPSDDDDDSAEEIFSAPGASRSTQNLVKTNSTDSFETPGISTDFTSILDRANK